MGYEDDLEQGQEEYDGQLLADQALDYVLENQFDDARRAVEEAAAEEWLQSSSTWLELLNIVSQHDNEQLKEAIRRAIDNSQQNQVSDDHLFSIASNVSKMLESISGGGIPSYFLEGAANKPQALYGYRPGPEFNQFAPYALYCVVGEDFGWAQDLVKVTRAFRDILFFVNESESSQILAVHVANSLQVIDSALGKGSFSRIVFRGIDNKRPKFGRELDARSVPLASALADWISEYLTKYSQLIDLGTCAECGRIFSRQRKDNAYCSKTCQNRVAYKRKKIFESGVLDAVKGGPDQKAIALRVGLCVYHSRLGLGVIESIDNPQRTKVAIMQYARIRFPQIVKNFGYWELFPPNRESKFTFYEVKDPKTLFELL